MANLLTDKNLDSANSTLANLNRALKMIVGTQGGSAHSGEPVLDALIELDWSMVAVTDFLEYVSGPGRRPRSCSDPGPVWPPSAARPS